MATVQSKFVKNVSEATFKAEVLEASAEVPVLIDFWASWCGPCRVLGPVLEKLAVEYNGGFILAKVNTEENPRLAMEFQIQSIPNCVLFRHGRPVDQFVGAYPEASIRQFLKPYCPTEADKLYSAAEGKLGEDSNSQAETLLREALKLDPTHSAARLALAKLLIADGRRAEAREQIDTILAAADEYEAATHLKEVLAFHDECQTAGGKSACRAQLELDPTNLDARFGLAACLAADGKYSEALEEFLAVVAKDKHFRDEAARKAMVALFSLVGERSELAEQYRTRLARTLY